MRARARAAPPPARTLRPATCRAARPGTSACTSTRSPRPRRPPRAGRRERGDAVGHQERVAVAQRRAQLGERMLDAGRGLRVHHGHHPGAGVAVELLQERVVRHALAPVGARPPPPRAVARARSPRCGGRRTRTGPRYGVARLEQVRDSGLHPGRARAVEREHQPVGHAVDAPQHRDDVEQDLVEVGVEVAEHRLLHRVEHRGVNVRRARVRTGAARAAGAGGGPCISGWRTRTVSAT